jgi:hypothetical protein
MDKHTTLCDKCPDRQGDYLEKWHTTATVTVYCRFPVLQSYLWFTGTVNLFSDQFSYFKLVELEPFYTVFFFHRPLKRFMCIIIIHEKRIWPSTCPHASARAPLNGLSWVYVLRTLRISVEKFHVWLNSDKNIGHFTWRPQYVFIVKISTKFFVARHQCKGKLLVYFRGNAEHFMLLTATCTPTTIKWKHYSNNGYAKAPRCYVVGTWCIL